VKIRILPASYSGFEWENKNLPTPFRPGMSGTVSIRTKKAENVLAVPILAVTVRNEKGGRDSSNSKEEEVVFLLQADNTAKQAKVKTGIQDDTYIEVKTGLKENDEIISGPYRTVSKELKDLQKVEKAKHDGKAEGKN
jgi:HlyD family secretion protein